MSKDLEFFVVVYQFGKVASTSVVSALNAVPGVEAVQSHFLGEKALKDMVGHILRPDWGSYFRQNAIGQLVLNADITHRINRYKAGLEPDSRLIVLSQARDPAQWLRSSFLQDVTGYLPLLQDLADQSGIAPDDEDELCREAIPILLRRLVAAMDDLPPLGVLARDMGAGRAAIAAALGEGPLRDVFYMMMRPLTWFDAHFAAAIGIGLDSFTAEGPVFRARLKWCDAFVFPYERTDTALAHIATSAGLPAAPVLGHANVSARKPLADAVRAGFDGPEAAAIARALRDSDYARFFGYASQVTQDGPQDSGASQNQTPLKI